MRHRIATNIGFGNPSKEILENNGKLPKTEFWDSFLDEAIKTFPLIRVYKGFDFNVSADSFEFGIEPAYQWDNLEIIKFDFTDKNLCYIQKGTAFGMYGSHIGSKYKFYKDYKYKSKYVKFIDKWFDKLKVELNVK